MRSLAAFVAATVVLTACSGDDDTAPTMTPPEVVSTTTESTMPPTTGASDPATTASSATDEATTTPSTRPVTVTTATTDGTAAPTRTDELDPIDDLAAAIQRDLTAGNELLSEVLADPSADDAEERLRQYFAAGSLDIVLGLLEDFRSNDFVVTPSPDVPNLLVMTSEPNLIEGADPTAAEVRTCQVDFDIVLGVLDDGQTRFPVNDGVTRYIADSRVELVNGYGDWPAEI